MVSSGLFFSEYPKILSVHTDQRGFKRDKVLLSTVLGVTTQRGLKRDKEFQYAEKLLLAAKMLKNAKVRVNAPRRQPHPINELL